jgi:hypothetical protein
MSANDTFPFPKRTLTKDWSGETALVIGNGTSIEGIDTAQLRSFQRVGRVIVMNSGVDTYPNADVLMCCDRRWLGAQQDLRRFKGGEIITTQPDYVGHALEADPRLSWMPRCYVELREAAHAIADPSILVEGHTSVSSAISMSVHRGVRRIIIIGLDLRPGPQRKRRAGDDTPDNIDASRRRYAKQAIHLGKHATLLRNRGVEIINCSPPSVLRVYPMGDLSECMRMAHVDSPRRLV